MNRFDIINRIGDKYRVGNTETGEFSYAQALKTVGKDIKDYQKATTGTQHKFLDIRFENERLVVLVECKNKFSRWDKAKIQGQLQDYVRFEKAYSDKKIVAILAETDGDEVWVWFGQSVIIDDEHRMEEETVLRTFEEYENLCFGRVNDKIKVVDSIKTLNEKLHSDGINEKLRSQFVGTCLLALKNGLVYKNVKETLDPKTGKKLAPERVVLKSIKDILEGLLTRGGSLNKAGKLAVLNSKVLDDQDVTSLTYKELEDILQFIDDNVVPYINDKSTAGQDLLNLFFTTFNKYVGKSDKNQAFTPDHICDFMSKAVGVNKNSRVLDPCCGSGAFLVRAMTDAMDDCDTEEEREEVKKNQIFGIEYEEGAFGLSSTNMLIHGDGNSNVVQDSMFKRAKWIAENNINIVLMNPPYNATKKCCDPDYTKGWDAKKKEDPSKGLHFVEWVARHVPSTCKMAVLLPMQAAIGNSGDVKTFKKKMLDNYTLDAVFSLPTEMFYPGAAAVACCMIFDLSQKHEKANKETFFGYYKDDKFIKRKGLGRVERTDADGNSLWNKTEEIWLNLYKNKKVVPGLSVMHRVSWKDESDGKFSPQTEEMHDVLANNFTKLFGLTIYAVNPKNLEDRQVKSHRELEDLFPYYPIPAERILGEDGTQKNESLSSLVADYFNLSEEELTPDIAEKVKELRSVVDSANKDVQKESDRILSDLVNKAVGFGYPNIEELQLGVTTELKIDDQIKNQTRLSYSAGTGGESLPSTHNGLGYKNLIKMEFLLAAFARDVEKKGEACIPYLSSMTSSIILAPSLKLFRNSRHSAIA